MTLHLALLIICVPFKANRDAAHSKLRFFYRIFFKCLGREILLFRI